MCRIATEERKMEIRRKIPAAKRYVVYPEEIRGENDLNADMRRKTRVGRRWQIVKFLYPVIHFRANRIRGGNQCRMGGS